MSDKELYLVFLKVLTEVKNQNINYSHVLGSFKETMKTLNYSFSEDEEDYLLQQFRNYYKEKGNLKY